MRARAGERGISYLFVHSSSSPAVRVCQVEAVSQGKLSQGLPCGGHYLLPPGRTYISRNLELGAESGCKHRHYDTERRHPKSSPLCQVPVWICILVPSRHGSLAYPPNLELSCSSLLRAKERTSHQLPLHLPHGFHGLYPLL